MTHFYFYQSKINLRAPTFCVTKKGLICQRPIDILIDEKYKKTKPYECKIVIVDKNGIGLRSFFDIGDIRNVESLLNKWIKVIFGKKRRWKKGKFGNFSKNLLFATMFASEYYSVIINYKKSY